MNQLMEMTATQQEVYDFAQWEGELSPLAPEANRDYFKPEEVGVVALSDSVRITAHNRDSVCIAMDDSVRITAREDSVRITALDDSVRITAAKPDFELAA